MPHPLAGQEILFTQQEHFAKRAGKHFDYRLVLGEHAYSWASKKEVPGPGSAILLFEQPIHDRGYALSPEVEIPDGSYGAGKTVLKFVRKAKVSPETEDDKLIINSGSERYLLKKLDPVRYGERSWLFKNLAPYKEGPDSTFTHDGNKYRVDDAIAQVARTKTNKVPVSELKWILKGSKPDKARLLEANPKVPLLITDWQDKKVVIDGLHRLTMAKRLGMDSVSTRWVDTGKLEKVALDSELQSRFKPDFTPEQMLALGVLRHKGSQYNEGGPSDNFFGVRASLDAWPSKWHNEQHPKGWMEWYSGYAAGKRTSDDERQIKRWLSFRARHMGSLVKADPSLEDWSIQPRRRQSLLNWAIATGDKNKYLEKLKNGK